MRKIRKQTPQKDSALRFDFNAAAKKALKDHPELKGKTLFIHAANDDWQDTAAMLSKKSVDEDDIKDLKKTVREAKRLQTSFHQTITREGKKKPFGAIVFHPDKYPLYGFKKGIADDTGTFDHETGHALHPKMEGTRGENTADAFASLRHLQRFNGETNDLDYCGWKRAAIFMMTGITSHLTTFTVDKIICDAKTADFLSLSPEETAAIAKDYAKQNTPDEKQLKKLVKDFKPLKNLPPRQAFKKLGALTLKAPADSPTFYLGARILSGALKGVTLDEKEILLKGKEWDDLREKLDEKIAKLPATHPLRNPKIR